MLRFGANAHNFTLDAEQELGTPLEQLFPFFADAKNLQTLTPAFLSFEIKTPLPIAMREGALIDYRIKLRVLPMTWRTHIAVWEPPLRFVDEQLKGPYSLWRHEHRFMLLFSKKSRPRPLTVRRARLTNDVRAHAPPQAPLACDDVAPATQRARAISSHFGLVRASSHRRLSRSRLPRSRHAPQRQVRRRHRPSRSSMRHVERSRHR
jgi:hypothetical protein